MMNITVYYYIPVAFPKFFSLIGERFFITKEFLFFVDTLTNVLHERATSQQVCDINI